jgi:hypothetical protein
MLQHLGSRRGASPSCVTTLPGATTASRTSRSRSDANTVYLYPVVPTGAIQISDVTVVGGTADPNANWQMCIYEDLNQGVGSTPSSPGAFLGET